MADGAVLNGLNRKLAVELAAETVKVRKPNIFHPYPTLTF